MENAYRTYTFADDIVMIAETPQELPQMLQQLADERKKVGLKMKVKKTQVIPPTEDITANNIICEEVDEHVYKTRPSLLP